MNYQNIKILKCWHCGNERSTAYSEDTVCDICWSEMKEKPKQEKHD